MKVSYTIVFVNHTTTAFMQAADIFERFKVIIHTPVSMTGIWEGKPEDFFNESHLKKMVDNIHAELKKLPEGSALNPRDRIAFIYSAQADNYYFDPTINAVSDGNKWSTAVHIVKNVGLQPIESKHPLYYEKQESVHTY